MYDYANILFTGKCNLRCYGCIGNNKNLAGLPKNTDIFPPQGIDKLIELVNEYKIKDLAFTGTNVDPQLYSHEKELIEYVRKRLTGKTNLSLHTNGLLALKKIEIFNSYDKASVSFPSFNSETFFKITKSRNLPDIKKILEYSKIPLKLSMLLTPFNSDERDIRDYIEKCSELGIKRIVIRKLKGRDREYPVEDLAVFKNANFIREVFGWNVYNFNTLEATVCGFDKSSARGLFLFSDGTLGDKLV